MTAPEPCENCGTPVVVNTFPLPAPFVETREIPGAAVFRPHTLDRCRAARRRQEPR